MMIVLTSTYYGAIYRPCCILLLFQVTGLLGGAYFDDWHTSLQDYLLQYNALMKGGQFINMSIIESVLTIHLLVYEQ
ncbi:hypothetical protein [Paenibacillus wynnii]|uniref:hypothetical protein n=1 Tax=Paenibacillus wynnii TaxID=268407 RepID=UPI00278FBD4B|nr:hypothetical protein [Paenibacillus wynnii]MDQ0191739.1 hypothetical protein [Paenibacillus wynnii]